VRPAVFPERDRSAAKCHHSSPSRIEARLLQNGSIRA
jgi:hypothetical protein